MATTARKRRLMVLGLVALACVSAGAGYAVPTLVAAHRAKAVAAKNDPKRLIGHVHQARLTTLTDADLARIRQNPQLVPEVYAQCRAELVGILGDGFRDLTERELQCVFCMTLSNYLAPYGDCRDLDLTKMLHSPTLNCLNYGPLMLKLAGQWPLGGPASRPAEAGERAVKPAAPAGEDRVALVGWDGGAIGNHQMVMLSRRDGSLSLLLDPTTGVLARTTFDALAAGVRVAPAKVVATGYRPIESEQEFRRRVLLALLGGKFRPSDLLYYFDGLKYFEEHYGSSDFWPTPGAISLRERKASEAAASKPAPN